MIATVAERIRHAAWVGSEVRKLEAADRHDEADERIVAFDRWASWYPEVYQLIDVFQKARDGDGLSEFERLTGVTEEEYTAD